MANDQNKTEWRVSNVSLKVDRELEAISQNMGLNKSSFIRSKMTEIVNNYPEHMRKIKFKD
jgi:hypothetical protein